MRLYHTLLLICLNGDKNESRILEITYPKMESWMHQSLMNETVNGYQGRTLWFIVILSCRLGPVALYNPSLYTFFQKLAYGQVSE